MNRQNLNSITTNRIAFPVVVQLIIIGVFLQSNRLIALMIALLTIVMIYLNWLSEHRRRRELVEYIEKITSDVDETARYAILDLPIPMLVTETSGEIIWYNNLMSSVIEGKEIFGQSIDQLISGFSIEKMISHNTEREMRIGDKYYRVNARSFQTNKKSHRSLVMIYFNDVTNYRALKSLYADERSVVALLQVDNYEDVMNETKEDKRPFVIAEIDKKINLWASRVNGLIKKYDKDKYVVIFEHKYLSNLEAKKFVILDDIREIDMGNRIMPTLSIGVAMAGNGLSKLEDNAFSALELALGRGGDQAVVRKSGDFEFYGGKSKAVEKRNKVKARIIAHALRPIIDDSHEVYIMGHKFPDMDSFGASIGIYRAVVNRGKEAYIVLEEANEAIKSIFAKFSDDKTYKFITPADALEKFEDQDLLIVVDTHRPNFTESPELLQRSIRRVLFDHHRRGKEFIDHTLLTYLEPYASSTSELVTEVLQYMEKKMVLEKNEAEALLAGIVVDTKNFSLKTGVRTFESAALLRRYDADTTEVKKLFQDELGTFVARSSIVSNAETYGNRIAISVTDEDIPNARLVAAQGADSLLNIRGIKSSFVIVKEKGTVFISSRSLGETNVQLIMESIGGGGHLTVAGAQFTDKTVYEVKDILLGAIDHYFKEAE
ncbi:MULTISPECIES: DHH family phosphoesterase [unclassified Fusibacter]|uniref:DHH family phosphoesterase n=1 Tax=unclassified Fusibacter TaxID=2624464 RepID=UPI001013313C|nr:MULTISPECIES: DHH family phosphoesterase [unclassified Fusibacter]MCK8060880.1 DHH family phosphoesterase [Fusibacter sp. A2]NPE23176.1 phosphoesterase [Fusibacter sp. A1]RXV59534.1 phosphoesterase [Fusibacter sp. A1]